jgi:hypothetical protein
VSDSAIVLIPADPTFVPDEACCDEACEHLRKLAPESEYVKWSVYDELQFFDCGQNFELVTCPACRSVISFEWWAIRMGKDMTPPPKLRDHPTPCCGVLHSLHQLKYTLSQGFGHFSIEYRNTHIVMLENTQRMELENILGSELRVIYRRI